MQEFEAFCHKVSDALAGPLPGERAHAHMSPSHRAGFKVSRSGVREGAVMLLLFPTSEGISTLFTVRRKDLSDHAGQISFPGGRREENETFQETAVRESEEEVGIPPDSVQVLGALTPLYIPPTRFMVHPFVGAVSELPSLKLQEREVESVLQVPMRVLADPRTRRVEEWIIRGTKSDIPLFHVDGHEIWGATAMITSEFLEVLGDRLEGHA